MALAILAFMKRLLTFVSLFLGLAIGTALAEMQELKQEVVKTEIGSDSLSVLVFDLCYVAEVTQERVPEFKTPLQAGKEHKGFKTNVYHPPTLTPQRNLFSYSKRL